MHMIKKARLVVCQATSQMLHAADYIVNGILMLILSWYGAQAGEATETHEPDAPATR